MWEVAPLERVEDFIEGCEKIPQKKIRKAFEKVEVYAEDARSSLLSQLEGKILYIRTEVRNHGLYRIFCFRRGDTIIAFDAHKKDEQKLPDRVRERVIRRYRQITGEEP